MLKKQLEFDTVNSSSATFCAKKMGNLSVQNVAVIFILSSAFCLLHYCSAVSEYGQFLIYLLVFQLAER